MLFQPDLPEFSSTPPAPATEKQLDYAMRIAQRTGARFPKHLRQDRSKLSAWIDANKPKRASGPFAEYPSSKQVAFAERIARIKRQEIPHACFRDRTMMSRWIDSNKPR